jgi:hypothetical protein
MKINELINSFEIYVSNEEKNLLEKLDSARSLMSFTERERFTIEGLIRKSLVIKIGQDNPYVIANEKEEYRKI